MFLYFVSAVLIAPLIGLLWAHQQGDSTTALRVAGLYAIFLASWLIGYLGLRKERVGDRLIVSTGLYCPRALFFTSVIVTSIVLGPFNGWSVLVGSIDKEEMRSMHGWAGPILAILAKYVQPALFAYAALCCTYFEGDVAWVAKNRRRMIGIGACTFVTGLALGGKASALIAILPGVICLYWRGVSFFTPVKWLVVSVAFLALAAWVFDRNLVEDDGIGGIFLYVLYRAFYLTAEASLQVGDSFVAGNLDIDYLPTLTEWFGKSVVAHWLQNPDQLYRYGFSTAITARLYPELIDRINSGEWNITPTAFVEVLVAGGYVGLMLGGMAAGALCALLVRSINRALAGGDIRLAAIVSVYMVSVYLSWINSGGVANLVHPVVLLGIAMCAVVLPRLRETGNLKIASIDG